MVLPLYLAMTAGEIGTSTGFPENLAYMACHFSPYGTGLSNLPLFLPEGSMLILNDRIPWDAHDASAVAKQLLDTVINKKCSAVLLDFQRPDVDALPQLITEILKILPCPVGVSHLYARHVSCPVFLPPVPLDIPVKDFIAPWQDREIWLEAALDGLTIALTASGSYSTPLPYPSLKSGYLDKGLHCHYTAEAAADQAVFTLYRTEEDLSALLEEASSLGITRAVGLWQELRQT